MAKSKLIRNSIVLTGFSLLMRLTTIAFSMYMAAKMGAEGMGLQQLTFSAFAFAVTLSTAGIVTAVTRVLSEEMGAGRGGNELGIMGSAAGYTALMSLIAAGVIFFASDFIGGALLHDVRTVMPLRIMAFSLPFMGACSCLKGFMLAARRPIQNAVSDVIEQAVEMGTFFVYIILNGTCETESACCAIALGMTLSEFISAAYLFVVFLLHLHKSPRRKSRIKIDYTRRLLAIAVPVTGSACLGSALRTVENVYIPQGLRQWGMTQAEALSVYGRVRGMTIPLLFLPFAFLSVLTALLLPEISEARAAGRGGYIEKLVGRVVRFTIILALPAAAVFAVYARQINEIFYKNESISDIILILSPLIPLMYFDSVADGILKGLGEQNWVLKCNMADSAVRLILVFGLIPKLGFLGFMIVMYVSNILNPVLSIHRMLKKTGLKFKFHDWLAKPLISVGAASAFVLCFMKNTTSPITAFSGAAALCIVYVLCLMLTDRHNKISAPVRVRTRI